MKNILFTIFRILLALVILGKILNWFLNFNSEINDVLNIAMFSLIGIAYIGMGYVWKKSVIKIVIIACGVFLIVINFFRSSMVLDIIGIFCILIPMIIARFYKEKDDVIKTI